MFINLPKAYGLREVVIKPPQVYWKAVEYLFMREKPVLQDERITALVLESYGLQIDQVEFLPQGADFNAVVYRVVTSESVPYFLKLTKGIIDTTSLLVPRFVHDHGIRQVIPPLKTNSDQLWTSLDVFTCILYPFIDGCNGFERALSDDQWVDFGAAVKGIHTIVLPPELQRRIPSETYSSYWREMVKAFQAQVEHNIFADPLAAKMAALMQNHRHEIRLMIERAQQLGSLLQSQPMTKVLCHSDLHAGNLLLTPDDSLYIVDWDNLILSPKERDLMFIGGGVGGIWYSGREVALFDRGYGFEDTNLTALAYYRYERIIQDIAAFCEQILLSTEGGDDREQGFRYFASQFSPNEVIEIAHQTYQKLIEQ